MKGELWCFLILPWDSKRLPRIGYDFYENFVTFTCPHFTTLKLVDIVKPVVIKISINSCDKVTNSRAHTPFYFIKLEPNTFMITIIIQIGVIFRLEHFPFSILCSLSPLVG